MRQRDHAAALKERKRGDGNSAVITGGAVKPEFPSNKFEPKVKRREASEWKEKGGR